MEEIADVLDTILIGFNGRYPPNIIDLVFLTMEENPDLHKRYREFADSNGVSTNPRIGKYVKAYTGMRSVKVMGNPMSNLIQSYTQLA
jgi:hypothetical protein